jgi:hypothetical protein
MTLIATKDLYNRSEYGRVAAGETFTVGDRLARELIDRGYAVTQAYDTKVIVAGPPVRYEIKEGTAAAPFRHVPAPDTEPPALVALGVAVRAVSDVPAPRDPDPVVRRKRGRPRKIR